MGEPSPHDVLLPVAHLRDDLVADSLPGREPVEAQCSTTGFAVPITGST